MSAEERGKTERKEQPEPEPRTVTVASLCEAWNKYMWLFGDPPHGTKNQLAAYDASDKDTGWTKANPEFRQAWTLKALKEAVRKHK